MVCQSEMATDATLPSRSVCTSSRIVHPLLILFRPAPIWVTIHIPVYGDSDGRQMDCQTKVDFEMEDGAPANLAETCLRVAVGEFRRHIETGGVLFCGATCLCFNGGNFC